MTLPFVDPQSSLENAYKAYLLALKSRDFSGDIDASYSSRLTVATDNSIYQNLPQAIVFPRDIADLQLIGVIANDHPDVKFSPRGGGTGTNGQSLTHGIVVDLSRYMHAVLDINVEQGWVKVQTGMVKDALNDVLRPYGFFFSPDLSTSNRATIGGMINTDASGQGSLVYGKTSDHILSLTSVLADGSLLCTEPTPIVEDQQSADPIVQQVVQTCKGKRQQILDKFPKLNRFLTGYDLQHAVNEALTHVDVSRIIAGSEGSLAFVAEAKLSITPIPKFSALINLKYDSFESALRHAPQMVKAQATSVETVDSNILALARQDNVWHSVSDLIEDVPEKQVMGLNMVEYNTDSQQDMDDKIQALCQRLDDSIRKQQQGVVGYQITYDEKEIKAIYAMRKKAVGLLGNTPGARKPIAFAEDTAVPPEHLADFIMEYRVLLDSHGLHYGMFGHVDAGVLHVRPALDMCDPEQELLMATLSDQVVALVAKYGGLMWGEHGKGYRSQYGPAFFGDALFTELRKIKAAFDPHNKMNPGKICTPLHSGDELVKVTDPKRGAFDRQIPIDWRDSFESAMNCNGNGLCFNYDTRSPMCPSIKITQDRRHSPKGRATMLREWLRLVSKQGVDLLSIEKSRGAAWLTRIYNSRNQANKADFSHEVLAVMDECLACKACAGQCPVKVDVPGFRARFLALYYQRYARPLKDYLVANIEMMAPLMAKMPRLVNSLLAMPWLQKWLKQVVGYMDTPLLSYPTLACHAKQFDIPEKSVEQFQAMPSDEREKWVVIVRDPFTTYYDAEVVRDLALLVRKLGFKVAYLPYLANGKPQHVKGFLSRFNKTARTAAMVLNQLSELSVTMIGLDPSMVLCYRDEYQHALGKARGDFSVLLPQEWLLKQAQLKPIHTEQNKEYALFAHCTEKTALPASEKEWQRIFAQFGLSLTAVAVGCCGMAGTYGHESHHLQHSKGIFELSWSQQLAKYDQQQILATGYSCRSQVKRFAASKPKHPIQVLLSAIQNECSISDESVA